MFNDLIKDYENSKRVLVTKIKESLGNMFEESFERYPDITVIKWSQYTPYFNDGVYCEFYISDFYVSNINNPEMMTTWGEFEDLADEKNYFITDSSEFKLISEIESFVGTSIGTEIFKEIFGDHNYITVTKDGIDIEEYDHD